MNKLEKINIPIIEDNITKDRNNLLDKFCNYFYTTPILITIADNILNFFNDNKKRMKSSYVTQSELNRCTFFKIKDTYDKIGGEIDSNNKLNIEILKQAILDSWNEYNYKKANNFEDIWESQ